MPKLSHRTQILLDEERYKRLQRHADRTHRSIGSLVREAIDYRFSQESMTKQEAVDAILNAEPMPAIDDWPKFKREMLDEMWGKHMDIGVKNEDDSKEPSGN